MFGKLGDMMGKLQEMKQKAEEIKRRLEETVLKTESTDGSVRIEISGSRKIKRLEITQQLMQGDKEKLENQLLLTFNSAIEKVDRLNEEEMKKAAGGLLPGL